jgi:hypothetical protein
VANDTYAGSEAGSSDYAYNVKRWLLSAETVFEEVATDDPLATEIMKLKSDADLEEESEIGENVDETTDEILSPTSVEQQAPVKSPSGIRGDASDPPQALSKYNAHPRPPLLFTNIGTAQAAEAKLPEQLDASALELETPFRRLSLGLDDEIVSFGALIGDAGLPAPVDGTIMADQSEVELNSIIDRLLEVRGSTPGEHGRNTSIALAIPDPSVRKPPADAAFSFSASAIASALSDSTVDNTGSSQPQSLSALARNVTQLLVALKELLLKLIRWSQQQASDQAVSDSYQRLGFEFNLTCQRFVSMGIDISDLGAIPDLLRDVLERTLGEDQTPENLERYLPKIREIVKSFLQGLKRTHIIARERYKQSTPSATSTTVDQPTKIPPRSGIQVGDVVIAIRECSPSYLNTLNVADKLPDAFGKRSSDEVDFPKHAAIKIRELDTDFGDGWYEGEVLATGEIGLFPEG